MQSRSRAVIHRLVLACALVPLFGGACASSEPAAETSSAAETSTTAIATTGVMPDESESTSATTAADAESTSTGGSPIKLDVGHDATTGDHDPLPDPLAFPTTCAEAERIPSSVGCEFFPLALPQHSLQYGNTAFLVSNVSAQTAHVVLEDRDGTVAEVDVAPGASETLVVGPERQLLTESGLQVRGYRLTSDEVLQVFVVVPPERTPTADASIVLPTNALGRRHRVVTYPSSSGSSYAGQYIAVTPTQDATAVTIELVGETTISLAGGGFPALDAANANEREITVQLDAYDVLVVTANSTNPATGVLDNDLTGSFVHSDAPVAVYSGTTPVYVPQPPPGEEICCADLLTEAVPPTQAWGRHYAAVKLEPRGDEPDLWRFVADHDGTVVTLSGGVDDTISLDAGEHFDLLTTETFVADGSAPFALVHFMVGSQLVGGSQEGPAIQTADCGELNTPGDPAMVWVYPRENWLTRYLFTVDISEGAPWCGDRITLVATVASWDAITHNGEPLAAPTAIAGSDLGYVYIAAEEGTHELLAPPDVGFEVTAYGYADDGSYVFSGGVGLQVLNPAG